MAHSGVARPWSRAADQSLEQLLNDASRIGERPPGGLMGTNWTPSPYADIRAALTALRTHTIYKWLESRLPDVLKRAPPGLEFDFVHVVAWHIAAAFEDRARPLARPTWRVRADKARRVTRTAITRVLRAVEQPASGLNRHQLSMLRQLLAELHRDLSAPRPKGKAAYPALEGLAYDLYRRFGIADTNIVTAVACAVELNCDERTAQRYVNQAKNS